MIATLALAIAGGVLGGVLGMACAVLIVGGYWRWQARRWRKWMW